MKSNGCHITFVCKICGVEREKPKVRCNCSNPYFRQQSKGHLMSVECPRMPLQTPSKGYTAEGVDSMGFTATDAFGRILRITPSGKVTHINDQLI